MSRKSIILLATLVLGWNQAQPSYCQELGLRQMFAGIASFYAEQFHGRRTASGAVFDMNKLTCAHKFLPFGTKLLVKNTRNGKTVTVTVNDRGPYVGSRVLDLSKAAARAIGMTGIAKVVCYDAGRNHTVASSATRTTTTASAALPPRAPQLVRRSAMPAAAKPALVSYSAQPASHMSTVEREELASAI